MFMSHSQQGALLGRRHPAGSAGNPAARAGRRLPCLTPRLPPPPLGLPLMSWIAAFCDAANVSRCLRTAERACRGALADERRGFSRGWGQATDLPGASASRGAGKCAEGASAPKCCIWAAAPPPHRQRQRSPTQALALSEAPPLCMRKRGNPTNHTLGSHPARCVRVARHFRSPAVARSSQVARQHRERDQKRLKGL